MVVRTHEIIDAIEEAQRIGRLKIRAIHRLRWFVVFAFLILGAGAVTSLALYSRATDRDLRDAQIANCKYIAYITRTYEQQYGAIYRHLLIASRKQPQIVGFREVVKAFSEFQVVRPIKVCDPPPRQFTGE